MGAGAGKVFILSGPSGVGKDTVLEAWQARDPRVRRVVAYTTRPRRFNETPDVDYHFVETPEFLRMADAGEFLEFKEVHGNHYGTPRSGVESLLRAGLVAVLKIDVQGALSVMEQMPEVLSVFLLPPSDEELERRIRSRATDTPESIALRLHNARQEMALAERYRYRLVNDSVDQTVDALCALA